MALLDALPLGPRTAAGRVLFGPHVTNLAHGRALSERHVAYYARRAAGGSPVIVTEEASVHASDWPYERAPLATDCAAGWAATASACQRHGAVVLAALGHAGGQGSSAYSQRELWAPSRVPEVASREVPKWMEPEDIAAVVTGFRNAAALAGEVGLDGVEVNAGQHSLVRQFLSGLTNHRGDEWGQDRLRFAREVLAATRSGLGADRVLGLRLSCDELAPWAGITPESAAGIVAELAALVDYVVVVKGSIYTIQATRPDFHEPAGFNIGLCRAMRDAVRAAGLSTPVVLQGSVVDVAMAEEAIESGVCDAVEMTRAQITDADLVAKARRGEADRVRPCIRCNQTCQVRDARNPVVTCVAEPTSGHEKQDPDWTARTVRPNDVLVVGGGVAGLECARIAAIRGHRVRIAERSGTLGGMAAVAGPGAPLVAWLAAECRRLGVVVETGHEIRAADVVAARAAGTSVVLCTGSRRGVPPYTVEPGAVVVDVATWLSDPAAAGDDGRGPVAVLDPIGGPIGVAAAERLGARAVLVTQDQIAGNELSRTGDLAPANTRLQQVGARIERRSVVKTVRSGSVDLEDRFTGAVRTIEVALVLDAGFRLPDEALWDATGRHGLRAGDAVAPRTYLEAVLEGRRAGLAVG